MAETIEAQSSGRDAEDLLTDLRERLLEPDIEADLANPHLPKAVLAMQLREPNYTPDDLAAIKGPRIAIVDGAHEEFILRQHTEYLARTIPGARLIILPDVSHFAPIQDPDAFNAAMIGFLDGASGAEPAPPAGATGQGSGNTGSGP